MRHLEMVSHKKYNHHCMPCKHCFHSLPFYRDRQQDINALCQVHYISLHKRPVYLSILTEKHRCLQLLLIHQDISLSLYILSIGLSYLLRVSSLKDKAVLRNPHNMEHKHLSINQVLFSAI